MTTTARPRRPRTAKTEDQKRLRHFWLHVDENNVTSLCRFDTDLFIPGEITSLAHRVNCLTCRAMMPKGDDEPHARHCRCATCIADKVF